MVNKRLGSALSKGKAVTRSFTGRSKKRQMEALVKRRKSAERENNQELVAKIDREIDKLKRTGRFTSTTSGRSVLRTTASEPVGFAANPQPKQPAPPKDIHVSVFLDTDDAFTTMSVVKATQRIVDELGYQTPVITEVERGSIIASFKAAWGSQKGQKVIADSKAKAKEIVEEAEQYARLHVQDKQADVDQKNVSSAVELMTAYADVPRVAIKIGAILFVKYPGPDGEPVVISRTLSTREINAYDKTPTIGSNPELVEQNLAILVAQSEEDEGPKAIEQ